MKKNQKIILAAVIMTLLFLWGREAVKYRDLKRSYDFFVNQDYKRVFMNLADNFRNLVQLIEAYEEEPDPSDPVFQAAYSTWGAAYDMNDDLSGFVARRMETSTPLREDLSLYFLTDIETIIDKNIENNNIRQVGAILSGHIEELYGLIINSNFFEEEHQLILKDKLYDIVAELEELYSSSQT